MESNIISENTATDSHPSVSDVQQTTCCIVGGGPAGVLLALLLARQGIEVMLLEAHKDFDRDFRGDTIHPSVMEIMEELGLVERLLQLPHSKMRKLTIQANNQQSAAFSADFSRLKTRYPYIMVLPQVKFLEFITEEAKKYPNFQLVLGANVQELIKEDGEIRGVRYRGHGGWHEIRSQLTVGADGRHSKLRQLVGFEAIETSPPMDVLWFRLPRKSDEAEGLNGRIGKGHIVAMLDRSDTWQIAYVIPKGGYQKLRAEGLAALRESIAEVVPELSDRVAQLKDWSQIAFLSVESTRLKRWYRPGLLLIGDAAHVMSPVGGVGINYAIQDAVVAANVLSEPLKKEHLHLWDLAQVQRQRELPTRIIQAFQSLMQQQILVRAMNSDGQFKPPFFLSLPILRDIIPRLIGFGVWSAHVKS
ncbi:2-polyprenyl-6-methoxyphenol hydroxylase and related FAD-dependent oxidoreductases [uncultured Coleofasciculus sp.]|uniref:2-polyprenyl-6-methoxyphenol hydroxylase and related FAD-dependent oxidoreductases n=1 Tax=uncultured Coleofasciculus sp. TaxID=1267456 RepID=A0A6J4HVT9_9CYAN|nr:2-polyprenyl-6-methoxyphenol hydroxylase and related FAD-dependent oxidoreductases [uncultured Coleofasciculus sp.]